MKRIDLKMPFLCIFLGVLPSCVAFAQSTGIAGTVKNASGREPPPGITGTLNGTLTDVIGNNKITVDNPNATLGYSFIGYLTDIVSVNGKSVIDISMVELNLILL